jgi:hypothetical protein
MAVHAGGPDRWRVICVASGGRHCMVLALPDNTDSDRGLRANTSAVRDLPPAVQGNPSLALLPPPITAEITSCIQASTLLP